MRHPLATGLYFASWLYLVHFATDLIVSKFPESPAARALKSGIG